MMPTRAIATQTWQTTKSGRMGSKSTAFRKHVNMSCEKMVIFGLCALLACLQHGVALPPGFGPVDTPTLSPSPSPSPLALPAPSPSSSPTDSVAFPFGDTLFSLPVEKPRESTATRVSGNEDDIKDIETRLSVLESSFENMTIIQNGTEVDIVTLRTDLDSLQSQMSSVTTSITSSQATAAASPATDYSADIAGLNAGLEGVVADLASARSTLELSIAEVEADVTTFHSSMTNTELRVTDNENAITEIHAAIDGLSSTVDSAVTQDTVDEIGMDLDELDVRIKTLELQGVRSQADIDSLAERVGGLENTENTFNLSAIDDQVKVLESAIDEVSGRTENMESSYSKQLSEQDAKIDELSASHLDVKSQLAEKSAEIGVCQKAGGCDDIHTMIEQMQTQAAEIESLLQSVSASSAENTAFVGKYTVKFDGMETTIADLQSQLDSQAASLDGSSSLQSTVDGLKADVAGLQEVGASTTSSLENVQHDTQSHAASIKTLQSEVTGLQSIVDDMVKNINAVSSASSDLGSIVDSSVKNLQTRIDDLSDTVDSMIEDVASQATAVAYSVSLQSDINQVASIPFTFDTVVYNQGNAYNKATGMFTAPVSGTYIFWGNVMVTSTDYMDLIIFKGSTEIGHGYTHSKAYSIASLTTTTYLYQGDQVWMLAAVSPSTIPLRGGNHSSYGGALIRVH